MATTDALRSMACLEPDPYLALRLKSAHSKRSMSDSVDEALRQALREGQKDLAAAPTGNR